MKGLLRIGALLLLLGGALFFTGCRSMADAYGSDIPNDPQAWELTPGVTGLIGN